MIPIPFAAPLGVISALIALGPPSGIPLPKAIGPCHFVASPQLLSSLNFPRHDHDSVPGITGLIFPPLKGNVCARSGLARLPLRVISPASL